jgi:hypothetical protein
MFLVHTNSDSAKREKVCHLCYIIYLNMEHFSVWYVWLCDRERVSTGITSR